MAAKEALLNRPPTNTNTFIPSKKSLHAVLQAEDLKSAYFHTTNSELDGRRVDHIGRAKSLSSIREQWPRDKPEQAFSALDGNFVWSRSQFSGSPAVDYDMNKQLANDNKPFNPPRKAPSYESKSAYGHTFQGPVGERMRKAKPDLVVNDAGELQGFMQGKSLVTKSFASTQHSKPDPEFPCRGPQFPPTDNMFGPTQWGVTKSRKFDFLRSEYQRKHAQPGNDEESVLSVVSGFGSSISMASAPGDRTELSATSPQIFRAVRNTSASRATAVERMTMQATAAATLPAKPEPNGRGDGGWMMSQSHFAYQDPKTRRNNMFNRPGRGTVVVPAAGGPQLL